MKTLRKISVLLCGLLVATLFLASCSGGHATTMHKHAFTGTAKQF